MIRIAHLYYDLLNLYGENGNMLAIKDYLDHNKIDYQIDFITVDDKKDFSKYDLIYLGSGTEKNILIALEDLITYKGDIKKYIEDGKYLIATGNANLLFGKTYQTLDKEIINTLHTFEYESKETSFRTVGEQIYQDHNKKSIIGFLNHQVVFKNYDANLFKVIRGNGYAPHKKQEGLNYNNFYGSLLIGPLLIRNPYYTQEIINKFLADNNIKTKNYINEDSIKAYETYLTMFK